jgi:hypothetical protein
MQRDQIASYLRTAGLLVGAALFILMIFRSGQNANNQAAVRGKPNLLLGAQQSKQSGEYGALALDGVTQLSADTSSASSLQSREDGKASSRHVAASGKGAAATVETATKIVENAHTAQKVSNDSPGHLK